MAERKATLKATVEPVVNLFGKRSGQYVARLSDTGWEVQGRDKATLIDTLRNVLKRQEQFTHTRRYIRKGTVTFALHYANGWQYDIIRDDGNYSVSCLSVNSYADALEIMLRHVAEHDGV